VEEAAEEEVASFDDHRLRCGVVEVSQSDVRFKFRKQLNSDSKVYLLTILLSMILTADSPLFFARCS